MLFNSALFLYFAIPVYVAYYTLSHRCQNLLLLVSSYVFYGYWDYRFLLLIFISTVVDYSAALAIKQARARDKGKTAQAWLMISIIVNLGILGFFKYFNFFADNFCAMMNVFGLSLSGTTLNIILPVGISFYTFQTMSYTIDVYRGRQEATRNFFDFALYVAFFPQLMAGPIERAKKLMPQIQNPRHVSKENICDGAWLILWGLFKKVFIADNLAPYCSWVFDRQAELGGLDIRLGMFAFMIQLYCDFSGYSDMARGLAQLLGIKLNINFNLPYFSSNPSEIFRRWHVTLGNWLRDYLYAPMVRTMDGKFPRNLALILTMLLAGLWHGASWSFVFWGGLWGLFMAVHLSIKPWILTISGRNRHLKRIIHIFGIIFTFYLINILAVFFRVPSIELAFQLLVKAHLNYSSMTNIMLDAKTVFFYSSPLILIQFWQYNKGTLNVLKTAPYLVRVGVPMTLLFLLLSNGVLVDNAFIYFQF